MPLPRRVLARLSMLAYRNPPMRIASVEAIIDALEQAGIRFWLSGGWGVDALAGAESRLHRDLDLVVDRSEVVTLTDVLAALGYKEWYRIESDRVLHARIVLHDHDVAGRAVDIHPVDVIHDPLSFAMGSLGSRAVPCLSPALEVGVRTGYRLRRSDRLDLAILRRLLTRPASALIVPVPAANALLHDSAREAGMPAHITLIYPFVPATSIYADTEEALASVFQATPQFAFALSRIGQFPNVVYLRPEPREPFVELSRALVERWPDHPPYGGAYGELLPHLTIAYGSSAPPGLAHALPVLATATEVWLMTRTLGSWVPRARFPLGVRRGSVGHPAAASTVQRRS
jgi:2'-5' RNA ligase